MPTESRRLIRRTCTPDRRSRCLHRLARSRCRHSRRRSRFPSTTRPPEISGVCSDWISDRNRRRNPNLNNPPFLGFRS
ncbi:hypothetical protein LINPERPRIM_LOCUS7097 [Linum perenne]